MNLLILQNPCEFFQFFLPFLFGSQGYNHETVGSITSKIFVTLRSFSEILKKQFRKVNLRIKKKINMDSEKSGNSFEIKKDRSPDYL